MPILENVGQFALLNSAINDTQTEVITLVWLMLAAALVAIVSKLIKLPYSIVLVIAGLGIGLVPDIPTVMLTPEIILLIFLPALLFEASYHLSYQQLRENFRFVSLLAIGGVILTALLTAFLLVWWGGISWQTALLFGTMVAATDPISVVAIFRKLGVSPRLSSIIESESLFNDGTALVLYNVILGVVLTQRFNFWDSLLEFLRVSVGV